jgi:hypothetical protein
VRQLARHRGRLAAATVLGVILVATFAAPSSAVVGTWGSTRKVTTNTGSLADAYLRAKHVAVGQMVAAGGPGDRLRLIRSTNAGNAFQDPLNVRTRARQASIGICGNGTPVAVYGRQPEGTSTWRIEQSIRTGGGGWSRRTLTSGNEYPRHPDVVCEADPSVVWSAWLSRNAGTQNYEVKVVRARATDSGLPASIIVGSAPRTRNGPALSSIPNGVFVSWEGLNGNIIGRRILFSGGLVMGSQVVVGSGSNSQPATDPQSGSFNQRVVVAWTRCADVFARVSTNGGSSWQATRLLRDYPCPSEVGGVPGSAAVRTQAIAIGYGYFAEATERERIVTTSNGFATKRNANITSGRDGFIVGHVIVSDAIRLGVVFGQGGEIRFRRCSTEECGPF